MLAVPAAATGQQRQVLGHQMVAMPRYGGDTPVEGMREEIAQWKELGLDGVLLFDIHGQRFQDIVRRYHRAGVAEDFRFGLSVSYLEPGDVADHAKFIAELQRPEYAAARLLRDGRVLLSAYHGSSPLMNLAAQLRDAGVPTFLEPQIFPRVFSSSPGAAFWESGNIVGAAVEYYAGVFDSTIWRGIDGLAAFEIADSIAGQADAASALWEAARPRGKSARASIVPYYRGLAHKGNWLVFEGWGFSRLQAVWRRAIAEGIPAVEFITLNDFAESTYVNSWAPGDPPLLTHYWNTADTPAVLDHSGFRQFSQRYVQWYKSGVEPAISRDELYYAYRLHPRDAADYVDLSPAEKASLQRFIPPNQDAGWIYRKSGLPASYRSRGANWNVGINWPRFSDGIHVAVRLTAPADVFINGAKVGANLPAGEHLLVKPGERALGDSGLGYPLHAFGPGDYGYPRFEIRRAGHTVMEHTGELEITPYAVPGCWNIFARRAPLGAASVSPAPAAGLAALTIGAPAIGGTVSWGGAATCRVTVGGVDIWDASDQFAFVQQPVAGDATLLVRVAGLIPTNPWAKAGLMLRASAAPDAAHVSVFVTPGNGVVMQWRSAVGNGSFTSVSAAGAPPRWLKLTRQGGHFASFASADGANWQPVSALDLDLPPGLLGGLAATSHQGDAATTADFEGLQIASGAW